MQYAIEVRKISDLREESAPAGQSWWHIDGTWYEWRQGAPVVRATSRRPGSADDLLPLDAPTKAAAKRAIYRFIWPGR